MCNAVIFENLDIITDLLWINGFSNGFFGIKCINLIFFSKKVYWHTLIWVIWSGPSESGFMELITISITLLYYRNVQLEDEGSYYCRAANEGGVTEKPVFIRVQGWYQGNKEIFTAEKHKFIFRDHPRGRHGRSYLPPKNVPLLPFSSSGRSPFTYDI